MIDNTSDWQQIKLGQVTDINPESLGKDFTYNEIEYIEISAVSSGVLESTKIIKTREAPSRAKRLIRLGDTIFSTVRPNRRSFLYIKNTKPNFVCSTGFAVLRPRKQIDSRFLYYLITNQTFTDYLTANAKGSAYPAVDMDTIKRAEIQIPSLKLQKKISKVLSQFDDLIENNLKRIKILEEIAQLIYHEWFVMYRFPGHKEILLIDSGSDFCKIPEGWEIKKMGEICSIIMGQSPKSKFYNKNNIGLPFHQGVTNFGIICPSDRIYCTINKKIANSGDILFSVRAPVGRINLANKKIIIGRGLCAIRNLNSSQSYTYYQLRNIFRKEDIIGGGTIFKAVTKTDVLNIKLVIPSKNILKKFEVIAKQIIKQINNIWRRKFYT